MGTTAKRFGTFEGVFTPSILSILGVVMYLRLGWVVGEVGLLRGLAILILANCITFFTGLSIATIITNMRVGTGGAYSIISKSLGYEAGGAIGIPLYLSQAISVAFYVTGFAECWCSVFPGYNILNVTIIVWLFVLVVSYISAQLAFRIQYLIMLLIGLSLFSIFLSRPAAPRLDLLSPGVNGMDFWKVFAIFFPAVTGILAGVSMSGELKEPEKNIPVGVLSAIGLSFIIYLSMMFWFAAFVPHQELAANTSIVLEKARWKWMVVGGILGATLSSALSMFVASSRTLLALSKHRVIPMAGYFQRISPKGEPTTAILFTALVSIITISFGTLDSIASILTMFFLITYGMLNIAVFIEKGLGVVSFRPGFKIPLIVSFLGGAGCIYVMFLINPLFSIFAILVTLAIYLILFKLQSRKNWPDVRKGIFIFLAERAIHIAARLPYHPKIWKPNLIVPVENPRDWTGAVAFLKSIIVPNGRVEFFKVLEKKSQGAPPDEKKNIKDEFHLISDPLSEEGILASSLVAESDDFISGAMTVLQTRIGSFLPPNVLFLKMGSTAEKDPNLKEILERIKEYNIGIMVLYFSAKKAFGNTDTINLWIRKGSPNIDLAVLVALKLENSWEARLRILQVVSSEGEKKEIEVYLNSLKKVLRLPKDTEIYVIVNDFMSAVAEAPNADINVFGMADQIDTAWMRKVALGINTSVLFLRDSRQESAMA